MKDTNAEIKAAIDAFDFDQARELLRDALKDADAETYYLASKVAIDDDQKQEFLEKAVEADPFHEKARKDLKQLKGSDKNVSEANKPKTAVEPKIPEPKIEQAMPEQYVSATIKDTSGQTELLIVPFEKSPVRTVIKNGAEVYIFARYQDTTEKYWFNVVYKSNVTTAVGWLPEDVLSDLHVKEEEIESLDIPITEFKFNKRDDFTPSLHHINTQIGIIMLPMLGVAIGGGVVLTLSWIADVFIVVFPIVLIVGVGIRIYLGRLPKYEKLAKQKRELEKLQKSLRSEYEQMRDDQRETMALGAALQLGTNVLTRMTPDKKETTVYNR